MKRSCMKVYSLSDQRADTKNMVGWETLEATRFICQRHWFGKEEVGNSPENTPFLSGCAKPSWEVQDLQCTGRGFDPWSGD